MCFLEILVNFIGTKKTCFSLYSMLLVRFLDENNRIILIVIYQKMLIIESEAKQYFVIFVKIKYLYKKIAFV